MDDVNEITTGIARIVKPVCRRPGEMDDAIQEGWIALLERAKTYKPGRVPLLGAARKAIRGAAIDRRQDRGERNARHRGDPVRIVSIHLPAKDAEDCTIGDTIPARERPSHHDTAKLEAMMEGLTDRQREVVQLVIYHGFTYAQLKDIIGMARTTARDTMRAALKRLRKNPEIRAIGISDPSKRDRHK